MGFDFESFKYFIRAANLNFMFIVANQRGCFNQVVQKDYFKFVTQKYWPIGWQKITEKHQAMVIVITNSKQKYLYWPSFVQINQRYFSFNLINSFKQYLFIETDCFIIVNQTLSYQIYLLK